MDLRHLILYVAVIVTAGISILLAAGMRKKFHQPFLNSLFYLVLFFNLASFFSIVWNNVLIDVLKLTESDTQSVIYFLLQNLFLLIPIYMILIYFLLKTIIELGGRTFLPRWRRIYWAAGGFFILVKVFTLAQYLKSPVFTPFQKYSHWVFWYMVKAALIMVPLLIFLLKRRLAGERVRDGVRGFGILYFGGMGSVTVLYFVKGGDFFESLLTILLIVPPLLFLDRQLKYDLTENAGSIEGTGSMAAFFKKSNITKREGEIIKLVARGKSNGEIADLLYLSEQTIKQHVHNIYRKLDVKNRVQLSNLVRNSLKF
jgi:DNA-binding CsgD family transcriptional regulator